MSEIEKDKIILELQQRVNKLEGKNKEGIPTYNFSNIKTSQLIKLVEIEENLIDDSRFNVWFDYQYTFVDDTVSFLKELIRKNIKLIKFYKEEDLKLHFLSHLFGHIDFKSFENNFRDFYNELLQYKTDKFIFNGETDFVLSKGLKTAEKPYFFIQEFKKGIRPSNPEPQLLAELISAIELNNEITMKGAYIVGATWNFVILEKLGKDKYQYFLSRDFNSTNIEDLKDIYKNLIFIKNEVIEISKKDKIKWLKQ